MRWNKYLIFRYPWLHELSFQKIYKTFQRGTDVNRNVKGLQIRCVSEKSSPRQIFKESLQMGDCGEKTRFRRINVEDLLNDNKNGTGRKASSSSSKESDVRTTIVVCKFSNCSRSFPTSLSLAEHQSQVHGDMIRHTCGRCKASFSTLPNLNKHVRWKDFENMGPLFEWSLPGFPGNWRVCDSVLYLTLTRFD